MLLICNTFEEAFRRFWGWNMANATLVLSFNELLTAMIGGEWEASAAAGESSSANAGSSQSNMPGNVQSRQMGYFGILCGEQCCTMLVLLASAICQIHMGVKLSQQGISMAGVCVMMQRAKIVFIVLNFSLLVNSGILARLCVCCSSRASSHCTSLHVELSCLQSGGNARQPLLEVTVCKGAVLLVQTDTRGEGGGDFSLPWSCLQHTNVEAPEELVRNHVIQTTSR